MMNETDVDYKALYEQVSDELTKARMQLFRIRDSYYVFYIPDINDIKHWIRDNYLVIIVAMMVASLLLSVTDFVWRRK